MTTFPSKQEKRQSLADPILIWASLLLIGLLMALGPLSINVNKSIHNLPGFQGNGVSAISIGSSASFTSDLRYWDANCSHGWTSDAACDALVSRTQACAIGTGSAYCSEYDTYLQQYRGQ